MTCSLLIFVTLSAPIWQAGEPVTFGPYKEVRTQPVYQGNTLLIATDLYNQEYIVATANENNPQWWDYDNQPWAIMKAKLDQYCVESPDGDGASNEEGR